MAWRRRWRWVGKKLVRWLTKAQAHGLENFPAEGPALLVTNHLGDADVLLALAFFPRFVEPLTKVELYDFPVLGKLMDAYGVIWVHRGQPDRRALRAALSALQEGRLVGLAPEGRQSLTGSLEEGTGGAAYLALKANVPIVPITLVGTEDSNIYSNLRRFRRPHISVTVGPPFRLEPDADRRQAIERGTQKIMRRLARQLPEAYRGVYRTDEEAPGSD